jgi:asparagine synthase (glutamine-hydrolysing)
MGGYPFFRQDMLMFNTPDQDPETTAARVAELNAANRTYGGFGYQAGAALATDSVRNVLGYVPTWIQNRAIAGRRAQPLLAPDFSADFAGRDPYQMFLNRIDLPEGAPRDPLNQSMWLWLKAVFPNKLLNFLGDRMEMAHSIEGRTPFLDHHVAELVCQMPVSMKVHGTTEKYVLREAARPFLTDTVYKRQKHPFMAPPELKGRLRELAEDVLRGPVLASVPFFDRQAVIRFLDDASNLPADQLSFYYPTWITMLSICVLHERYGL